MMAIASKHQTTTTGLSAKAALSYAQRFCDGHILEEEKQLPACRAIDNVIFERSNVYMATLRSAADSDEGVGAGILKKVLVELHKEKKAGMPNFEPFEVCQRMEKRCAGRGEDPSKTFRADVTKFLGDTSTFVPGSLAIGVDTFFTECATLRVQAVSLSADSSIAGDAPMEAFMNKLTGQFELRVHAGETSFWTMKERAPLPYDRIERYQHLKGVLGAFQGRVTKIAVEMDDKHAMDESRRRGAAAAQTKEASEKAAKDKAAKDKAAKEPAAKVPAAKLRANAATTSGPTFCFDCGKTHSASATCANAGKGKVCWGCGEGGHNKTDCPKLAAAGNAVAQTR
jgi:hypothetical protein